jgi:hypothetical protein
MGNTTPRAPARQQTQPKALRDGLRLLKLLEDRGVIARRRQHGRRTISLIDRAERGAL